MKPSYIQSLLSPPGTHPAPVLSPPSRASPDSRLARKYSLIKEDSQEENMEDPEEEIGEDIHVQPVRTFEDVEEKVSARNLSEDRQDGLTVRWPLVSVASSPQLLNQIFEENESDEDDDFVPDSLHVVPTTYGAAHASMASPEILRKYEQRKKRRGGGQRGASCSSSDASDTDDTAEGRSRKDKLKHKFVHRRDSSDHSSDTDGPSGGGGNLGSGGGHYSGSGSSSNSSKDGSKKPAGKKDGGGKGSKGGGGGGGGGGGHKSKQHQVSVDNIGINVDSQKLIKKLNEINMASLMPNSCSRSPRIVSEPGDSLREKNFMFGCSQVQYLGQSDSDRQAEAKSFCFSEISSDQSDVAEVRVSSCLAVCSPDCVLVHKKGPKLEHKIKRDINSNGFPPRCCQPDVTPSMSTLKVESKCCSVV